MSVLTDTILERQEWAKHETSNWKKRKLRNNVVKIIIALTFASIVIAL